MAEKLTHNQRQAVENRGGQLLVSAAAGSGKTKVLVDRLLRYICDPVDPANIDDFLIITYTKAAASELRGKIAGKLSERLAQESDNQHLQRQLQRLHLAKISTVHSFCGDILREYAYKMEISGDFRVIDELEAGLLRQRVVEQVLEVSYQKAQDDPDFCAFIDTQGLGRNDNRIPEIIISVYERAQCHLKPAEYLAACLAHSNVDGMQDAAETVWGHALMQQLKQYLDLQIHAMQQAVMLTSNDPAMDKPRLLLQDTIAQLSALRDGRTWDDVIRLKDIDYGTLRFSKKIQDPDSAEKIKAIRDGCKQGVAKALRPFADPSHRVLEDLQSASAALRGLVRLVETFTAEYNRMKNRRRCLDFSDLEHLMLDLLYGRFRSGITSVAREIGGRFREVLVDEYQDSNAVQDAIFAALTEKNNNLFLVGDVKQSIYQFRLADPGIFLDKYQRFAPVEEAKLGQGRKILLSHNFRSGDAVLQCVNDVFSLCMSPSIGGLYYGAEEALREGVPHQKLPDAEIELAAIPVEDDTYKEESAYVAFRIRKMLDNGTLVRDGEQLRPVRPDDIVILLRSPNSVGEYYIQELENVGVHCVTGGQSDLLQSAEIKLIRSLLEVIHNPRQDIPLVAILASPLFDYSADELAALRVGKRHCSFYDAVKQDHSEKSKQFLKKLNHLRTVCRTHGLTKLLEEVYLTTRYDSVCSIMDGGETRVENLHSFFRLTADFESIGSRDLGSFLQYLSSLEQKGVPGGEESSAGAVRIMSIHKSKGLEFPVVFLCGLSRGFNRESQHAQVLCDSQLGIGLAAADATTRVRYPTIAKRAIAGKIAAESLSEELRVLYVAMTRAKDRLIMTYASDSLETQLRNLVLRMDICDKQLLCNDVSCPGIWVLLTALRRLEAGQLHTLAGRPDRIAAGSHTWRITVEEAPKEIVVQTGTVAREENGLDADSLRYVGECVCFVYPHALATQTPSKLTATQLKGREKDMEAAENAPDSVIYRSWRRPAFVASDTQDSVVYGNLMHCVMQYIQFDACHSLESISGELDRLVAADCISPDERQQLDPVVFFQFFSGSMGQRLCGAKQVLREFKFSVLADAPNMQDEKILLQGVVDCAIEEEDGLVLVDFKTDRIREAELESKIAAYTPQVETYATALEKIFQKPVKEKYLYFFDVHQLCAV